MYYGMILVCMAIISLVDIFIVSPHFAFDAWFGSTAVFIILSVIIIVAAVIIIDAITATFVRWCLPKSLFTEDKKGFMAGKKECRFYEKIGIKKWKDKIAELGMFTNFRKNKISDPKNPEYIKRYIMEANYGVSVHLTGIIFGFAVIFVYPLKYWLCFGLPIAIVNAFYNAMSLIILRYNLPKLHTLYKFNMRHKKADEPKAEQKTPEETAESEAAATETK